MSEPVEQSLQRFLKDYPNGPVYVYTAFTSGWGLGRLGQLTLGRPVTLLLGDPEESIKGDIGDTSWRTARAFLARDDVTVERLSAASPTGLTKELVVLCDPRGTGSASYRAQVNLSGSGLRDELEGDPRIAVDSPAARNLTDLWLSRFDSSSNQHRAVLQRVDDLHGTPTPSEPFGSWEDPSGRELDEDPFALRPEPPPPPSAPRGQRQSRLDTPRPETEPERPDASASVETGTKSSQADNAGEAPPTSGSRPSWPPPPPPPPPRGPRDRDSNGPRRWIWTTVIILVAIFALLLILAQFIDTSDESSPQPTLTPETTPATTTTTETSCHPAYTGYCVPILPEGENFFCDQVPNEYWPFDVPDPTYDPYGLDGNDDGEACEPPPERGCHSDYEPCLPTDPTNGELTCADIPYDSKPVTVLRAGEDPFDLDPDGDALACDPPTEPDCHPDYVQCLPREPAGGHLDCDDIATDRKPVDLRSVAHDEFKLDRDNNLVGCQ